MWDFLPNERITVRKVDRKELLEKDIKMKSIEEEFQVKQVF